MFRKAILLQLIVSLLVITLSACTSSSLPENDMVTNTVGTSTEAAPTATLLSEAPSAATSTVADPAAGSVSYSIVDTGQGNCYDDSEAQIGCPTAGKSFYGQDAQYSGAQPSYTDNGDGTVIDEVTDLMWQQSPDTDGDGDIDAADKLSYAEALAGADTFRLAGYDDWRLPTIKELYSLIDFGGLDPSGYQGSDSSSLVPFIDTGYFDFAYGDTSAGERLIDAQFATSTIYVNTTMNGNETMFGVNLADGRIKGYPTGSMPGRSEGKRYFVLYVRGNPDYGVNDFEANGDGTIDDGATGLTWAQTDSGTGLNWEEALAYCESSATAGHNDWRLPNAKELQGIVDYSRSPDTTSSAAIDPLFSTTAITNEAGQADYPFYWSGTTHANVRSGDSAAYVAFGRSMGYMSNSWIDVHGAGSQRSDPKAGDPADWPTGHGPQGDAIRIYNHARCVRGGDVTGSPEGDPIASSAGTVVGLADSGPSAQPAGQGGPGGQPTGAGSQSPGRGGQQGGPGRRQAPDLVTAAARLAVTEEALRAALGDPSQGSPDFAASAQTLGVTELGLKAALGMPAGGQPPAGGPPPGGQPPTNTP